jgi:hypothetical protein
MTSCRGVRWSIAALVVLTVTTIARAAIEQRTAKIDWDKNDLLHGALPMNDAIDVPKIKKKLADGLPVTVQMRGYVIPVAGGDPVVFTAHTCRVAYDLWNEVYEVTENGQKKPPAPNMKGVYRRCTSMDVAIVNRANLPGKAPDYQLHVKIDVNPVDPDLQKKIQQWVTRPSGTTGSISPGDALFATFANVFIGKKIQPAEHVLEFNTQAFPP